MAIGASACSRIFRSLATFWRIAFTCLKPSLKYRADFTRLDRPVLPSALHLTLVTSRRRTVSRRYYHGRTGAIIEQDRKLKQ